eukprot:Gregarina_sp_Poly_1__2424@NODE_1650_length_3624_cov_43_932246_g1058_i1_p2_GENE_NODE_1650_length_3624_cov_43_932246_g1058_i1NODE_1650_length_3624_cov_43_932246_g1058_i1_p2_ORF_typecomplete_len130_score14_65_NODE_1650_length_3624_cov_43_932246_g1058_i18321221
MLVCNLFIGGNIIVTCCTKCFIVVGLEHYLQILRERNDESTKLIGWHDALCNSRGRCMWHPGWDLPSGGRRLLWSANVVVTEERAGSLFSIIDTAATDILDNITSLKLGFNNILDLESKHDHLLFIRIG